MSFTPFSKLTKHRGGGFLFHLLILKRREREREREKKDSIRGEVQSVFTESHLISFFCFIPIYKNGIVVVMQSLMHMTKKGTSGCGRTLLLFM